MTTTSKRVTFLHHPKYISIYIHTRKINMELKNRGGWKMIFHLNCVIFRFQPFIFRGVCLVYLLRSATYTLQTVYHLSPPHLTLEVVFGASNVTPQTEVFRDSWTYPPSKTNMTNWKIPIFNRRYIFIHGCFSIVLVSFRGKNIKVNLEWIPL